MSATCIAEGDQDGLRRELEAGLAQRTRFACTVGLCGAMTPLTEIRQHWRPLSAASIGLAFGYTFNNYVLNVMSPHLIAEFGWNRAQFALLGVVVALAIVCQPIGGRLADVFGERRVALVGVVSAPLLYILIANIAGAFWQFAAIAAAQVILVGSTTSIVVYTRLIARNFEHARGVALGIASSAPAIVGAIAAPTMALLIAATDWRGTYFAVAAASASFGALALALVPHRSNSGSPVGRTSSDSGKPALRQLLASWPFRLIVGGTLLCNLTITMQISQISVMLADSGVSGTAAGWMIALYGVGVVVGRLLCGLCLDRFAPHIVAAVAMATPAIGLLVLASGTRDIAAITFAIATLGISLGAEGDVGGFMVMRYFPKAIYGSVMGLVMGALAASGTLGALLLSATLEWTGGFTAFMQAGAGAALLGGGFFLSLGLHAPVSGPQVASDT